MRLSPLVKSFNPPEHHDSHRCHGPWDSKSNNKPELNCFIETREKIIDWFKKEWFPKLYDLAEEQEKSQLIEDALSSIQEQAVQSKISYNEYWNSLKEGFELWKSKENKLSEVTIQ